MGGYKGNYEEIYRISSLSTLTTIGIYSKNCNASLKDQKPLKNTTIEKDREATMARFLSGLNHEIADVVEVQHYVELEDMVHMAIKVERQQKKKNKHPQPNPSSSSWKSS